MCRFPRRRPSGSSRRGYEGGPLRRPRGHAQRALLPRAGQQVPGPTGIPFGDVQGVGRGPPDALTVCLAAAALPGPRPHPLGGSDPPRPPGCPRGSREAACTRHSRDIKAFASFFHFVQCGAGPGGRRRSVAQAARFESQT